MEEISQTGTLGMGGHGGLNLKRQFESGAALAGGDAGRTAGADRFEEGLDLKAQGLAGGNLRLQETEAGGWTRGARCLEFGEQRRIGLAGGQRGGQFGREAGQRRIDADDEQLAAGVIDRDVLVGLEEAELSDPFRGDARSGKVGNAAGLELDADVGDIDAGRDDGQADGANLAHRRGSKGEHDVEIVDHQVEHYIYVEGAGREDAEPVGLKEHGAAQTGLDREYGRIEALEMAGLENSAAALGARNQVVGLGECGGQGLFDEQVDAGIEQLGSDRVVVHGGHGYVGGVEPEVGREQSFHRRKDGNAVLSLNLGGARGVRLDGGDQSYALRGLF